jgi:hypothetical protein
MLELLIGIISLAIAAGQVVAAPKKERPTTIVVATVAGCVAIPAILGYQYYQSQLHRSRIEHVANLVLNVMDRPQTFDDIYNRMDYPNYREVDEAFDLLFENGRYEHQVVRKGRTTSRTSTVSTLRRAPRSRCNGIWTTIQKAARAVERI